VLGPLIVLDQTPLAAARSVLWLLGCLLALLVFWRLAISTATNLKFSFNVVFWLGVVGAGFALFEVFNWAEGPLFMAIFIAPAICALHFVYIQHRKVNK
jgi:hypothetical protein